MLPHSDTSLLETVQSELSTSKRSSKKSFRFDMPSAMSKCLPEIDTNGSEETAYQRCGNDDSRYREMSASRNECIAKRLHSFRDTCFPTHASFLSAGAPS
jgi:hypothetical protein